MEKATGERFACTNRPETAENDDDDDEEENSGMTLNSLLLKP